MGISGQLSRSGECQPPPTLSAASAVDRSWTSDNNTTNPRDETALRARSLALRASVSPSFAAMAADTRCLAQQLRCMSLPRGPEFLIETQCALRYGRLVRELM